MDEIIMNEELENARTEYSATVASFFHYDNFSWQVAGIIIAGVIAYWGLLIDNNPINESKLIAISNFFILVLTTIWFLYSAHNRQIYLYKLHRIYELEELLQMRQNLRFKGKNGVHYKLSIKGNHLDKLIYIIINFGNFILGYFLYSFDCSLLFNLLFYSILFLPFFVILYTVKENNKIKSYIDSLKYN